MKRQIMKSLMALCAGIMTFGAASSLFVSCDMYDDSELREQIADLDERLQAVETLKTQLAELAARVDGLYTLTFQESDDHELQYSFDGKTWIGTGIYLTQPCDHECPPCEYVPCDHECPEVSLIDNGDSVTIKVGDAEFTIEKPQEIVFEIRSGRVYFLSEATQSVNIVSEGIDDLTVISYPKGWYAEIAPDGTLEVTAPNVEDTVEEMDYETWTPIPAACAAEGYVKVHACSVDGKCMVGKLPVIVSNESLAIVAYDDNVYITSVSRWGCTFYYGISTKDSYKADAQGLIDELNSSGWSENYLNNEGMDVVEETFESIYGSPAEKGVEYVVWALMDDYNQPYSIDDVVIGYYSLLEVKAEEIVEARTAYNVDVNVSVTGAESYVGVAIPESYCDSEEALADYKSQMVTAMQYGEYYGKKYSKDYTGSVLNIAEGTQYSMTGQYAPDSKIYLLILPIDGRPNDAYTAASIHTFEFTTSPLTSGGSIDVTAVQVTEYMGEEFSYEDYQYHEKLIVLDPMTQLGVEISLSNPTDWVALYAKWMTADEYALTGGDEELLVDALLQTWGMAPEDGIGFPYVSVEKVAPNTTMHFVALAVDANGKYGKLANVELTSAELQKANLLWAEPFATNVVNGVLSNTDTFEFTPTLEEGEAASYKYVWQAITYYNSYEGKDDAQMAEEIYFSSSAKTIEAAALVDGKIAISGHKYGTPYYLAIVPIDANGAPGASAAIFEYSCEFSIENVISEGAEFDATVPEIVITLPTEENYVADGNGDGPMYYYEYQDYYEKNLFHYDGIYYEVTPKEGTTVCSVIVDAESYSIGSDVDTKAGQIWQGSLGSYYTKTTTEYMKSGVRSFRNYEDEEAPSVYLMVSWTDADGNYYFKEYDLKPELDKLHNALYEMIYGPQEEEISTPDGKQLTFNWEAMNAPSCVDFGVYAPGKLSIAYDMESVYGAENLPAEMLGKYQVYMQVDYELTATDATSGTVTISTQNMFGETETATGTYTDWNGTTCTFNLASLMISNAVMTASEEPISLYFDGGAAM